MCGCSGRDRFLPAFSSQAKFRLPEETRRKVSTLMCHDTRTADRFYTRNPTLPEMMKLREQMMLMLERQEELKEELGSAKALEKPLPPAGKAKKVTRKRELSDSDSDSDTNKDVPYQESGMSSSTPDTDDSDAEPQEGTSKTPRPKTFRLPSCTVKLSPIKAVQRKYAKQKIASKRVKRMLKK